MRNRVQPHSLHCDLCNGELRIKLIETNANKMRIEGSPIFVLNEGRQ